VSFTDISVIESTTGQMWRATSDAGAGGQQYSHFNPSTWRYASSLSYITGSHAVKGGFQLHHGFEQFSEEPNGALAYTLRNGVPTTIFQYANPIEFNTRLSAELGIFIQDQWTFRRLTLTGGLRYDALRAGSDAMSLPPGIYVPARQLPETTNSPNWKNVSPRMAASYDLFGDGKTAVKATLNKYVGPAGANAGSLFAMNPGVRAVRRVSRTWGDANGDFSPDCDLHNFDANGECGAISDRNFGQNNPNATVYADELLQGYRDTSWETTAIVQRQITDRVSLTFGYYHRDYANFIVNDNILVSPSDFSTYCITAPVDARLPGGGGNQVCGLYDVDPALFGRNQTVVRAADHYGEQHQVYDGYDITETLRLPGGGQRSGGVGIRTCRAQVSRRLTRGLAVLRGPATVPAEHPVHRVLSTPLVGPYRKRDVSRLPSGSDYCELHRDQRADRAFVGTKSFEWSQRNRQHQPGGAGDDVCSTPATGRSSYLQADAVG
jgi:hypothetical protein